MEHSNGTSPAEFRGNEDFEKRGSAANRAGDGEQCLSHSWMFFCGGFESLRDVLELLGFVQDGVGRHGDPFHSLRRGQLQTPALAQKPE